MDNPITDSEAIGDRQSFIPSNNSVSVTIEHHNGSEMVEDFHFVEEVDNRPEGSRQLVRVWYSDPMDDDSDYRDFHNARITEVSP